MQLSLSVSLTTINRFMSSTAAAPALDRVVNFVATGSDAMYQDNAIFNNAGAFPATGGWMMAFMYYDGTNWSAGVDGIVMGLADTASASRYMTLNGNQFIVRDGVSMTTTAATTPAVGWHLVTGYFVRHATDTTRIISNHFLRDGAAVVSQSTSAITGGVPASFSRLGLGYRPRSTPDAYATFKATGFAVGTGNPASLHAWVYNGGAFGRKITDYPGDAGVAITHYWPGARVGDATLSGSETALQDTVGSLDAWTLIGAPVWATPAPPFEAGIVTATTTAAAVPSGATNTMVVTATIPTGRVWGGTPTVDLSKVDLWATLGFGPITATAAAVSLSGTTATVTLTLDRAIYASEPLQCALAANWLGISGALQSDAYAAAPTNSSPTADPANWPGVSTGQIAWRFQTAVPCIRYPDLVVRVPVGTVITDEYPARAGGLHGAIKNPARVSSNQPYDSRALAYVTPAALPWTLAANDTVSKARSNPNQNTDGGGSLAHPVYTLEYGGLHCLNGSPAANEMAPPIVYDTPASRPAGPVIDFSALTYGAALSTTGMPKPTYAQLRNRIRRFDPAFGQFWAVENRRQMLPAGLSARDGYGQDMVRTFNAATLFLASDYGSTAEKQEIEKWMIHRAVQSYDVIKNTAGTKLPADGATSQHMWACYVLYLVRTGQLAALATLESDIGTNELNQIFVQNATTRGWFTTPHTAADLPGSSKIKTISSVVGNAITCDTMSGIEADAIVYWDMKLKRISDGAEAFIVRDASWVSKRMNVDAQPVPPFTVGDQVYAIPGYALADGDADFAIKSIAGPSSRLAYANLTERADYRYQYKSGGQAMGLQALGFIHSSHKKVWDYTVRAATADTPTTRNNFASTFENFDGTVAFEDAFWTAHSATLAAVSQTVG